MDSTELSKENHMFFYVDFPKVFFDGAFDYILNRAVRIQDAIESNTAITEGREALPDDRFGMATFECQNGEVGYVQVGGKSAKLIQGGVKNIERLLHKIPRSIQGPYNDRCVILADGIEVSFRIVGYEGVANDKVGFINDPTSRSVLEGTPLGRVVAVVARMPGETAPAEELICAWGAS